MNILSPLISNLLISAVNPFSRPPEHTYARITVKIIASLLLILAYVLGCIALYNYLAPCLGEALSLLALCSVFLGTSLILFIVGWCLKPKSKLPISMPPMIEKAIDHIPSSKDINKALHDVSPLPLVGLVVAVGVISYFMSKSKNA